MIFHHPNKKIYAVIDATDAVRGAPLAAPVSPPPMRVAAVLALLGTCAYAQDAQMLACQSDLVSMSDSFNAACCSVRIVLLRSPPRL